MIITLVHSVFAQNITIWSPLSISHPSAIAIQAAAPQEFVVDVVTTLPDSLASRYIFAVLGAFPDTHVLSHAEAQQLAVFLNTGGALYMEGGDTWAWDEQTELHAMFNIWGIDDGRDDLNGLYGSGCFHNLSFSTAAQAYTDRLAPLEGAFVLMCNDEPAYVTAIGYDSGVYRTIGASFSFASLLDTDYTKTDLLSHIMDFFEKGCEALKPPPMALSAYSGYDTSVPLIWNPPVMQQPLHNVMSLQNFYRTGGSISKALSRRILPTVFTLPESPTSYSLYRGSHPDGPFDLVADNIKQQYYLDQSVSSDQEYWFYVTAQYADGEGDRSEIVSSTTIKNGALLNSALTFSPPVIDGDVQESEWWYTQKTAMSNDAGVQIFAMNDSSHLYLAIQDSLNSNLNSGDQLGLYLDLDMNREWPQEFTNEGNVWLNVNGASIENLSRQFKGMWPNQLGWTMPLAQEHVASSVDKQENVVTFEASIDLTEAFLNKSERDSLGFYIYSYDAESDQQTGAFPVSMLNLHAALHWAAPVLYGTLYLGQRAVNFHDSVDVSFPGLYTLNDKDGHKVDMLVLQISGSGQVVMTQLNSGLAHVPNADDLFPHWEIDVDHSIRNFGAKLSFHYTEKEAQGFTQSADYWGMAGYNPNTQSWRWIGGDVNADARTVTIDYHADYPFYAMFRRSFGDVNADGQVDSVDVAEMQSVWHSQKSGAFEPHTRAHFFNYHQQPHLQKQRIDIRDLQILGDCIQ